MSERPEGAPMVKIGRRGLTGFFRDVQREMRQVNWPTRQETTRLTGVVLGVCGLIALMLTVLSFLFEAALRMLGLGGGG
ncbi:MAG: preprotein translocase subunit SecE [Fimbriimonadaceae bacterium]|nr:preprotein translocase subunit SecE [Fimbriimonadaceae bacterium]QYK54812.1 MAG: preprotein translocase subunit SecE [Fimbriimonadaceae bacterium]